MNDPLQGLMEQAVLQAAKAMEEQLDEKIHQLDNMGEDDLEILRCVYICQDLPFAVPHTVIMDRFVNQRGKKMAKMGTFRRQLPAFPLLTHA